MKKYRTSLAVFVAMVFFPHDPVHAQAAGNPEAPTGKDFVERLSRTSDMLFYGDTPCLMDRSPLSAFDGYLLGANPDEPQWHVQSTLPGSGPVYYEKNYSATWKIAGDSLYLIDLNLVFVPSGNDSDSAKRALLAEVGEATGLDLENAGKPLLATWFGGTLRVKRARTADESHSDWIDAPFYEITVEKGRITESRRVGERKSAPASDWLKKRLKDHLLPARFEKSLSQAHRRAGPLSRPSDMQAFPPVPSRKSTTESQIDKTIA